MMRARSFIIHKRRIDEEGNDSLSVYLLERFSVKITTAILGTLIPD